MPVETLFDKHQKLEVGEVVNLPPAPGTGPMPQAPTVANDPLLAYVQKEAKAAEQIVNPWREFGMTCCRFRDGNQYDDDTRRTLRMNQRPDTAFNQVQKYVRYVTGQERGSPQALLFLANVVDNMQQQVLGEFCTNVYEWSMRQSLGAYERSEAFKDLITTGIGCTTTYIDKMRDPRGIIKHERFSPFEALWPDCADKNMRSTRWRGRESWIPVQDAERRWPEHALKIRALGGGNADSGFDGRPSVDGTVIYTVPYIETMPVDRERQDPSKRGKVKVLEFQWVEDMDGWMFADPASGEPVWLSESDFRTYKKRLQILAPINAAQLQAERQEHRVCRVVYALDRTFLLSQPKRLPGDRFSLNFMTGSWDEAERRWYGLVAILMDPQRYANKFFNQVIEIMGTSAKSGYVAETAAFDDPAQQHDFENTVARAGSLNIVAAGALAENRIQPKTPPPIPVAAVNIIEFCITSMKSVTGIDASGMGFDEGANTMPAMTMRQKQAVGNVMLAEEFDALSRYRLEDEGPVILSHLALIADGRLIRVGGPEAQQVIPLLRQPFMLEYDLQLDDTEHDPNLRQVYTNFLLQIGPMLAKLGLFTPTMFNYLPFPVKVRQEIMQSMQAQQSRSEEANAAGVNLKGRGAPRTPEEIAAKVADVNSRALLHQARAKALMAESRRDDMQTVVDAVQGFQRQGLERDRLEAEGHHQRNAHVRGLADVATKILQALAQNSTQGGGAEVE